MDKGGIVKVNSIYQRRYRKKASKQLKEKWRKASLKYYYTNKEKIKQSIERRKDKIFKTYKKYYKKNRKKIIKYHKEYYLKNKEKILKRNGQYAKNNPEIMKKAKDKYIKNNPDLWLWNSIRNRCNHNKSKLKITKQSFLDWYNNQKKICEYCKILESDWLKSKDTLTRKFYRLQIDRKDNNKGYSLGNIVLACPRCNFTKSNFFNYNQMLKIGRIINATH